MLSSIMDILMLAEPAGVMNSGKTNNQCQEPDV